MSTRSITAWQNRILPLVVVIFIVLISVFIGISTKLTYDIHSNYNVDGSKTLDSLLSTSSNSAEVLLEKRLMDYRYEQSKNAFLAGLWLKYLGFLTGIIIVFLGAFFVLSKLSENESHVEGDGNFGRFLIKSGSPGVILASLGVIIMLATLFKSIEFNTDDRPRYINPFDQPARGEYFDEEFENAQTEPIIK